MCPLFSSDIIFQGFPNTISPQCRVIRAAEMQAGYEKGQGNHAIAGL